MAASPTASRLAALTMLLAAPLLCVARLPLLLLLLPWLLLPMLLLQSSTLSSPALPASPLLLELEQQLTQRPVTPLVPTPASATE